ncbi:hypothetical protein [Flagellimonas nanhaiensis]|nr:hypothetical protein [Allomuricauda nanhaiensis]
MKKTQRLVSVLLVAFMLGVSNVVLEEDRMVNDSRKKVEQKEIQDVDDV